MKIPAMDRLAKWLVWTGDVLYPNSRTVYEWLARTLEPGTVLDVGCCFGAGTSRIASAGHKTMGVDVEFAAVQMARGLYPELTWWLWDLSVDALSREFDYVIALESFEHMKNQDTAMKNMLACARKRLVITTPNAAETVGKNAEHEHELTQAEMVGLVEEAGGRVAQVLDAGRLCPVGPDSRCGDLLYDIRRA